MQIQTGFVDVAVVEAHSKASDVVTLDGIIEHALDPIWNKPLGAHPFVVAGVRADAYLSRTPAFPKELAAGVPEEPPERPRKNPVPPPRRGGRAPTHPQPRHLR